jgi:hypothetical protein
MSMTTPFEIKPAYSIPELACALRWSVQRVRRLLASHGVPLVQSGRRVYVARTVFEKSFPDLWESMVEPVSFGGSW